MSCTIPKITLGGSTWTNVTLKLEKYAHGEGLAMQLYITEDLYEELLATCTLNLVGTPPHDGCVWIKNYAENAGMLLELTKAGIVEPTGYYTQSGYVDVPEARILIPIE